MKFSSLAEKKIHFVGIGGMGMSALARLLFCEGRRVSGSDAAESGVTQRLRELGIKVFIGHAAGNVGDAEMAVYSSAVGEDNTEILAAKEKPISLLRRGEMLAKLMESKNSVAVCGTHGKTTTASMIGFVLDKAGLSPTIAVGANVSHFDGNAKLGNGEHFVAEADESDGSFLYMSPSLSVVTNIEKEHMEHYGEMVRVRDAYLEFLNRTKGISFLGEDCDSVRRIRRRLDRKSVSYGVEAGADLRACGIAMDGFRSRYDALYMGKELGQVELSVPGAHNVVNSLAALGAALECGIEFETIASVLKEYKGAQRRFEVISKTDDVMIVDDYGHHPTEVKAAIASAGLMKRKRLIGIFQPHRYTRTLDLKEEFAGAFEGLDELILTDLYAACEKPIEGVSVDLIYDGVRRSGHKNVIYLPKEKILGHLLEIVRDGDLVLFIGAGNIGNTAYELAERVADRVC